MVTINDVNVETWGLILVSTDIEKPTPKTYFVDLPLSDGSLDLSEASGEIKYARRNVTMKFKTLSTATLETVLTTVANAIHGQKVRIKLDKDPGYYYYGRAVVEYLKNGIIGDVTISALCDAYKYKNAITTQEEVISSSKTVVITNDRKKAFPKITTTAAFSIVKDGVTYSYGTVSAMQTIIPLLEGSNTLEITGTGTITFEWQEGAL